jgi:hypothetical protein
LEKPGSGSPAFSILGQFISFDDDMVMWPLLADLVPALDQAGSKRARFNVSQLQVPIQWPKKGNATANKDWYSCNYELLD